MADPIYLGTGTSPVVLLPRMANRHGLIAGATGTGKTVTLQVLAEGFSRLGVPVFMTDVKGDLSGISQQGTAHPRIAQRIQELQLERFSFAGNPAVFWDLFGKQGHPVRTTITEMGPLLLSRLLNLNETQEGVLAIVFRVADDNGWLLLDLKDLRAMLRFVAENRNDFKTTYGNISPASVGAIQRRLIALEDQGGEHLFAEPELNLDDLMQTDAQGRGIVNILSADRLINAPQVYSTFLLWLMSEFFEELPEVGDRDKPRFVLFFDEAHLLFDDAPHVLLEKIEQVVRLIRSKGVGVYFITQNPMDIPESVLGQLGNRIQHTLRAFTPKDQKAVRVAAQTFRTNPDLDTEAVIKELGVGEALVSMLNGKGHPEMVQRTLIAPPRSHIGSITEAQRAGLIRSSLLYGVYEDVVDRESAYEILKARATQASEAAEQKIRRSPTTARVSSRGRSRQGIVETLAKSAARSIGTQLGRQLMRGLLGSLFKGR